MIEKLGVDFDGVIQDSRLLKSDYLRTRYKINVAIDLCKRSQLVSCGYVTHEQYSMMVDELYETERGLGANEVNGAIESIKRLTGIYDILVVTSRSPRGVEMARKWLIDHQLASLKIVGTCGHSKDILLKGFDHYIDDDLEKLLPLRQVVKNSYLYSWSYNQADETPNWIKRINNWQELEEYLGSK